MKKVRLGNDIKIVWSVTGAQWVSADGLSASLYDRNDRQVPFDATITVDETTGGGTIEGTFYGKDQEYTGTYRLLLQMNKGKADMLTLDHIEVFQLVDVCSFGIVEGLDSDNLTTATVEVSDAVSTIIGNTDLSSFVTRAEFETALAGKQGTLTWDDAPTKDSDNAISSGVVFEALSAIKPLVVWNVGTLSTPSFTGRTWADLQSLVIGEGTTLLLRSDANGNEYYFRLIGRVTQGTALLEATFATHKADSTFIVYNLTNRNGAIQCSVTTITNSSYTKTQVDTLLLDKMDNVGIDSAPTSGSLHLVTSGGIYAALQNVQPQITIDPTPTMASPNPVSSGGVYAALQGVGGGNMQIVTEGSATTISPIADKYYVLTYDVETLTVNLPNLAAESSIKGFVLFFHVGTYQSITINPAASGQNVYYYDGFEFADDTTYEMNFVWNGAGWIVAYGIVSGYANS